LIFFLEKQNCRNLSLIIEEPLRKKQKTSLQVKTTFVSGQTARVQPEERNLAPANGWMTKDEMESRLTF